MGDQDSIFGPLEPINNLLDPRAQLHVGRARTVVHVAPNAPEAGTRPVAHPGKVRRAIGSYDCTLLLADGFKERHAEWSCSADLLEDLSYQREAATFQVIRHGGIEIHGDGRIANVTSISVIEEELLRIFFEDVGHEVPLPHLEKSGFATRINDELWSRERPERTVYDLAAGVYRMHVGLSDYYGSESDRIGWYLACWILLASDSGVLPHAEDTFWFVLRQKALDPKVSNKAFIEAFNRGLGLLEGHGLRRYWFSNQ
jgi:hypothetical protein